MDIDTYYSILEWRGISPRKIDPSSQKEFGRKIYEKDIELGKTVWVNNKFQDFKYFLCYYDPLLSTISNTIRGNLECNEVFMAIVFITNIAAILAAFTASIGFNELVPNTNTDIITYNELTAMSILSCCNGIILCTFLLKWRSLEGNGDEHKLSQFISNQNGLTVIFFTLCTLSLAYYFVMNEWSFYLWFLVIYALQFVTGWMFELICLYISFCVGWKRDHKMVQLVPQYANDGSFAELSLPKCVYYINYRDYEEWMQEKEEVLYDIDDDDDEQLDKPLLTSTTV